MSDDNFAPKPPDIRATVEMAENGYIVRSLDAVTVCEADESERGEAEAVAQMLYAVLEAVGAYGSKHDAYRVRVSVIERDSGKDVLA